MYVATLFVLLRKFYGHPQHDVPRSKPKRTAMDALTYRQCSVYSANTRRYVMWCMPFGLRLDSSDHSKNQAAISTYHQKKSMRRIARLITGNRPASGVLDWRSRTPTQNSFTAPRQR